MTDFNALLAAVKVADSNVRKAQRALVQAQEEKRRAIDEQRLARLALRKAVDEIAPPSQLVDLLGGIL